MTDNPRANYELALRIARLEGQVKSRVPQLAFTTLEAGAITEVDQMGNVVASYGQQYDGSHMAMAYVGITPLQPTPAIVTPGPGELEIEWLGTWVDNGVVPTDFTRVEVHASADPLYLADESSTLYSTIETPRGAVVRLRLPAGVPMYIRFVARNLAGQRGPASVPVEGIPEAIMDQAAIDALQADVDAIPADIATAKAEAIATAASDATAKANQAEQDAIAAAALDAQARADQAEADAIAAAALDAQARADLAEADALAGSIPRTAGAVTETYIAADAVTSPKILAGSVTTVKLDALAVTTEKLAALAVVADKIAAGAITSEKILAGEVTAGKLAAASVIAGNIAADAVTASTIVAGAISTDKLATDSVTAIKILAGSIVTDKIATDAVTAIKILAGSITTAKLDALAVTADKIAANAITADKVDAGAITAGKLAAGAVIAGNIEAGAVTATTIAADALNGKVITGAVIQTDSTGSRMVIGPDPIDITAPGRLEWWDDHTTPPAEDLPPGIWGGLANKGNAQEQYSLGLSSGRTVGSGDAVLWMRAKSRAVGAKSQVDLQAQIINFNGLEQIVTIAGDLSVNGKGIVVSSMQPSYATGGTFTSAGAGLSSSTQGSSFVFVAPASGRVVVTTQGYLRVATAGQSAQLGFEIREGNVERSGTLIVGTDITRTVANYNTQYIGGSRTALITGLTPGATYNCYQTFNSSAANAVYTGMSLLLEHSV